MIRTAIVSAMQEELAAVLALMPDEQKVVAAGREFWVGHLQGHEVVAVLSRIGKVAAATTATTLIERFGVERILFTGVAGGLGGGVRVGDIVVAANFLQHDMDASPIFPRHEVPLYGLSRFKTDATLSAALAQAAAHTAAHAQTLLGAQAVAEFVLDAPRVHTGLVLSGDRFVATTVESRALITAVPDALAVEMEGAAIAQVCHDYAIPFAAVRTISDRADDAAHVDFTRFIAEVASRYSAAIVEQLLHALPAQQT
jgi:adenosylhomocysteine nucleosidase